MIKELMSTRRFAPLFWAQFFSALNDNVLKNALVIILLYGAATSHGDALVTVAGAVFIFPFFILSGLGGELADKFVKSVVARRLKHGERVFEGDQAHLHHRFLRRGFTQARATLTIWVWCLSLAAAALSKSTGE